MSETSADGYICTDCGAHIAGWQGHACRARVVQQPNAPVIAPTPFMGTPWIDTTILERIAKALESIAEKLNEN